METKMTSAIDVKVIYLLEGFFKIIFQFDKKVLDKSLKKKQWKVLLKFET